MSFINVRLPYSTVKGREGPDNAYQQFETREKRLLGNPPIVDDREVP